MIGVGRIGAMHARLLSGQVPGAVVTAVNDARPEAGTRSGTSWASRWRVARTS